MRRELVSIGVVESGEGAMTVRIGSSLDVAMETPRFTSRGSVRRVLVGGRT